MKRDKRWAAEESGYYDESFGRLVSNERGIANVKASLEQVAKYTEGSVLDLGCGVGYLADMIDDREYFGIDFSEFAIEWARCNIRNPNARFCIGDLRDILAAEKFDTVVLVQVLEHLEEPAAIAKAVLTVAKCRIVVTVPSKGRGAQRAHVWPNWTCSDLTNMFGKLAICHNLKRGRDILAVYEIGR